MTITLPDLDDPIYDLDVNLGDVWSNVSFLLKKSDAEGRTIRVSEYSNAGMRKAERGPLIFVGDKVREVASLLDSPGKIDVVHAFSDVKINNDACYGSDYLPTKAKWHGFDSTKVACQLSGGSTGRQNLYQMEVERVVWELRRAGYDPIPVGLPLTIAESIKVMQESAFFVGIDSGMCHVAHSVGLPIMLMQARVPKSHIGWIYGPKAYNLFPTVQKFCEIIPRPFKAMSDYFLAEIVKPDPKDVLILTCWSKTYFTLLQQMNHGQYANKWGFRREWSHLSANCLSPWGERVDAMIHYLAACKWLWFVGADTLVTNFTIDCRQFLTADLAICWDRYGINNDSFFLRNSPAGKAFLEETLKLRDRFANDQDAMWHVISHHLVPDLSVDIRPQREFNSYRYDLYDNNQGAPAEMEGQWLGGDFLLHLPGLPIDKRLELMQEHKKYVIK